MPAIICVMVGENEPATYPKFGRLSQHLDIIEVLPRKRDGQGKLLVRDAGVSGRREYLCIHVDLDALTDEQFDQYRYVLRNPHLENTGGFFPDGAPRFRQAGRRRYRMRESALGLLLTAGAIGELNQHAAWHRQRDSRFDLWPLNQHLAAAGPWTRTAFEGAVEDKATGLTLLQAPLGREEHLRVS